MALDNVKILLQALMFSCQADGVIDRETAIAAAGQASHAINTLRAEVGMAREALRGAAKSLKRLERAAVRDGLTIAELDVRLALAGMT